MTTSTTVVVADDHAMIRAGLRSVLDDMPGVELAAEVGNGEDAVAAVASRPIDLVVMDLHMPGIGGIEAIRQIRRR